MSLASELEVQMLLLINAEREAVGLNPVQLELTLNDSAADHSLWMIDTDTFSHTGSGGSRANERMMDSGFSFSGWWAWGENIAWQSIRGAAGLEDDVINLHTALMNSPGHRANILSENFDYIGLGIEVGEYRGFNAIFVTQNFARTGAEVQLDPNDPSVEEVIPPNTAPTLVVEALNVDQGDWNHLAPHVQFADADGDEAVAYRITDQDENLELRIGGESVDASSTLEMIPQGFNAIEVVSMNGSTQATLSISVFDGEDWSEAQDLFIFASVTAEQQQTPDEDPAPEEFTPTTTENYFNALHSGGGRFSPSLDDSDAARYFFHSTFDFVAPNDDFLI